MMHVVLRPQLALVSADTALFKPTGELARDGAGQALVGNKVIPLPAARCVAVYRGDTVLQTYVAGAAIAGDDFDAALVALTAALAGAAQHRELAGPGDKGQAGAHAVHLVGWSRKRRCMAHVELHFSRAFKPGQVHAAAAARKPRGKRGRTMSPAVDDSLPQCANGMLAAMRNIVAAERAADPHARIGGQCVVAELTPDAVSVRRMGDLGLPA